MASLLFLHPPLHCHEIIALPSRLSDLIPSTHLVIRSPTNRGPSHGRRPASVFSTAPASAAGLADDTNGNRRQGEQQLGPSDHETVDQIKAALYKAVQGINRGIFGVASAKKSEIHGLVELLESRNPTPQTTDKLLEKVDGCWKLVYSTISILGVKRTKLGLRDLISLGEFIQTIDVAEEKAVNEIKFNVSGLKMLAGQLTIEASYKIASKTRVEIKLQSSTITPDQLRKLFQKNYDLLLSIFNPEGWLDITYVDDSLRIGRDDKGNIFVLEKIKQAKV